MKKRLYDRRYDTDMMASNSSSKSNQAKTHLVSNSYGSEVISRLHDLQQNDELCDFTVTAEGKSVRVSVVLLGK